MTDITYTRTKESCSIDITGHAGYAAPGSEDIVCAAATMLSYTIAAGLSLWDDEAVTGREIRLTPGDIRVYAEFVPEVADMVAIQFETVSLGFDMLSNTYPNNVKFTVIDSVRG